MIIDRNALVSMFNQMRNGAPWNVDGELLWGYYFLGGNVADLEPLAKRLQADGYRLVGIEQAEKEMARLHCERLEKHTVDSLDRRNVEMHGIGEQFGVEYDGMDVGAPPKQGT